MRPFHGQNIVGDLVCGCVTTEGPTRRATDWGLQPQIGVPSAIKHHGAQVIHR